MMLQLLPMLLLLLLLAAAGTAATSNEPADDGLDLLSRKGLLAELRRVRSFASTREQTITHHHSSPRYRCGIGA